MKSINIIFAVLLLSSCISSPSRPPEANMICGNYLASGKVKYETFTFCGVIPTEVEYHYRYGIWKFWDISGNKLAQGEYSLSEETVRDQGGCPYTLKVGIIDKSKWMFWDQQGDVIKPSEAFLNEIQECSIKLIK